MAKYLVIVESPAKVKTIKKFLGANYEVAASNGHVRDLPKSSLGIDVDGDYEPKYITIRGKGDILSNLRKLVKKSDKVFLATDPDREGEAISWHLAHALNIEEKDINRISFNEITKNAVKTSIKNPRKIDMNLVYAQQSRRMLDRMVGYRISPLLGAKVKRGLSAGRVQSVALRMICDREDEINAFIQEEYWTIDAILNVQGEKKPIVAKFLGKDDEKIAITSEDQVNQIMKELEGKDFSVSEIKNGERSKKAPLPFTTSTLQQEAAKTLNYSTQKTMRIAQQLYEGVDIKGEGTIGLISYLRTDSTRISEEAEKSAGEFISRTYGEGYYVPDKTDKKTGKKIQDAHEAIRPTNIELIPSEIKSSLTNEQFKLYQLIWKRFTASRMSNAVYETTNIKLKSGEYRFSVSASRMKYDGYTLVYTSDDDERSEGVMLNSITENSVITLDRYDNKKHFTQPPAHYTEASLVKAMEEQGIGRPSTYAPTISTITARRYVTKEQKNIFVTELGEAVNGIMKKSFPSIVDLSFTANMESLLDMVEEGSVKWKTVVENFYPDLDEAVKIAEKDLENVKIEDEKTDIICDNCGRNMVIKYGPYGKFLACPGFPECHNTKPYLEKAGVKCPDCGEEVIILRTRKGRKYYGCENTECKFMSWNKPTEEKCPECGSYLVEKGNKHICSNEECGYVINR